MPPVEFLICAVLIGVSAFLSSSEIAIFSLSRFQIRSLKDHFRAVHRRIKRLLADPAGLLVTILVVNEAVNIALSALITSNISQNRQRIDGLSSSWNIAGHTIPGWAVDAVLGTLVTAPIILFLCEVTPKVIAA